MPRNILSLLMLFASSAVFAEDICPSYMGAYGPEKQLVHCALTGLRARNESKTLQVDCDVPFDQGAGLIWEGFVDQSKPLSTVEDSKLKVLFAGEREATVVADLNVLGSRSKLGDYLLLPSRMLCRNGSSSPFCEQLSEKTKVLDLVYRDAKGLSAAQLKELKQGRYLGKEISAVWFSFSLRLKDMSNCSITH